MELTAVLTPAEEGGYVALNPETGTTTQGETVEEAIANLTEATALYLSEFPLPAPGHPLVTMFSVPAIRQSGSHVIMRRGSKAVSFQCTAESRWHSCGRFAPSRYIA